MAEVTTPHDAVLKTFLFRVETARDFIELHLPPSLIKICRLETLRPESGSFVGDDLRPYFSGILYSLEAIGEYDYVHVFIEYQSLPDKHTSLRLMRYAITAMQCHLKVGNDTLSLATPVLSYRGK